MWKKKIKEYYFGLDIYLKNNTNINQKNIDKIGHILKLIICVYTQEN